MIDFLGSPRHCLSPKFWLFSKKREFFNSHSRLHSLIPFAQSSLLT